MGRRSWPCTADCVLQCGWCCFVLSLWGVVQLSLMAWLYYFESTPLINDVEPKVYKDHEDFLLLTSINYLQTAMSCFCASSIYAFTLLISIVCIVAAKKKQKRVVVDEVVEDNVFCEPPMLEAPELPEKKKSSKKKT